jgi:hypothetical protein
MMSDKRAQLIYLVGTLFSKSQDLSTLLEELAAANECQGELALTHRTADGRLNRLLIHIDGAELTITPDESEGKFRLDISDQHVSLE